MFESFSALYLRRNQVLDIFKVYLIKNKTFTKYDKDFSLSTNLILKSEPHQFLDLAFQISTHPKEV